MSGVFSGGASEQAPSSSVSAPPDQALHLTLFILMRRLAAGERTARRRAGQAHLGSIAHPIGRVWDHAVVRSQTRGEFDDRTQVAFDRYRLEQYAVVGADGGDGEPLGVENQRARRHAEHI